VSIGVFGGSFDPPHICHVMVCQYALSIGELDRVLVVPCAEHPFGKQMAPFEDRLEMCRLAMANLGGNVEICDIESRNEGVSYTIDTLRTLQEERPGDSFRLIIGSDILEETEEWKDFDEIKKIAPLLVVPRGSRESAGLSFSLPDASSSAIREALSKGNDCEAVVPPAVLNWISQRGLY